MWLPLYLRSLLDPQSELKYKSPANWDPFQVEDRKSWEVYYTFQVEDLVREETKTHSRLKTENHGKFVTLSRWKTWLKKKLRLISGWRPKVMGSFFINSSLATAYVYEFEVCTDLVYCLQLWVGSSSFLNCLLRVYPPSFMVLHCSLLSFVSLLDSIHVFLQ